jgi:hypothetical protein
VKSKRYIPSYYVNSGTWFRYFAYKGANGHNSGTWFRYFACKGANRHNSGKWFRYFTYKGANGHNSGTWFRYFSLAHNLLKKAAIDRNREVVVQAYFTVPLLLEQFS